MSRIGQGIIEGLKELVEYSEGKIDLRTSRLNVAPVCETISVQEQKRASIKYPSTSQPVQQPHSPQLHP